MLEGIIYEIVPITDVVLGQHNGSFTADDINMRADPVLVLADTMRIKLFSTMGDVANPQE